MSEPIRLSEYQDSAPLALSREDATFIAAQFGAKLSIRRAVTGEGCIVNPKQHVGVVVLPSGRHLESMPKIPVESLFAMLAVAFDLPSPFRDELAQFARLDDILEFVARYFADLVERRIDQGLYRSYVEQEENLATIRGRIVFVENVRRNYVLRHRTFCRYTEFTWDIPENQIIRQVLHMLGGWQFRPQLRLQLQRLDGMLAEVTPTHLPASAIGGFRYHRLNDDYRQLHQLCRLFLEGASVSEDAGPFDFQTFLIDMNKLFEGFITQVLRDRARGVAVSAQESIYLGRDKKVLMRPDIVLRRDSEVMIIADCKYKRLQPDEFKNHDVYQMLAYCTAMRAARGLLIYPVHSVDLNDAVLVRHTDVVIRHIAINLAKKGPEFDLECDAFATSVFTWMQPDDEPANSLHVISMSVTRD